MNLSMDMFQYRPLKQPDTDLRLLKIKSVTPEAVHCRLIVTTSRRKTPVQYNALSYTWGDDSIKTQIIINDKSLYVTFNLENALRHLDTTQYYWIDAVCINQDDLEERNHQIQRMRDIYRFADMVIIWLGRYHEDEDEKHWFRHDIWGFTRLEHGTAETTFQALNLLRILRGLNSSSVAHLFMVESDRNSLLNITAWAALARLLKRDWFERLVSDSCPMLSILLDRNIDSLISRNESESSLLHS